MRNVVDEYCNYRSDKEQIARNTVENNRNVLNKLVSKLSKPLKEATENDISKFLEGYESSIRDLYIMTLRRFRFTIHTIHPRPKGLDFLVWIS